MSKKQYIDQAETFLTATGTVFSIEKAVQQKKADWAKKSDGKSGINYTVTLSNKNGDYKFDFWGSIADAEIIEAYELLLKCFFRHNAEAIQAERILEKYRLDTPTVLNKNIIRELIQEKTPDAYDVLACLDVMYNDTFEDFCFNYGYDDDSITVKRIYDASMMQDRMLRKLFSREDLEKLQEIN